MSGTQPATSTRFPVSVVVERRQVGRGLWSVSQSEVVGVVPGGEVSESRAESRLIHEDEGGERHLWSGLVVELFKDGAESYWYNLVAEKPSLFVVCRGGEDEEEAMYPFLVSANYDEASAYLEGDDTVFSVPLPSEIHDWLERYVVENYEPTKMKKRKRKNWKDGDE